MGSQPEIPSGLEPAPQNYPELSRRESRAPELAYYPNHDPYQPPNQYPHNQHPYPTQVYHSYPTLPKPDDPYGSQIPLTTIAPGSPYAFSPNSQTAVLSQSGTATGPHNDDSRHQKRILGCSRVVFLLSSAIVILFAAVIGLAAATGVENIRANDSEKRAAALSASLAAAEAVAASATAAAGTATVTVTVDSNPSATSFPVLTNGCSDDPEGTTGKNYTSFGLLGSQTFTMACGKDTIHDPLLGLFVSNFQTCMDACTSYSKYVPGTFDLPRNVNSTCGAVSFIPLWTNREMAFEGGAPGNCYLKPGPMVLADLRTANIGTECHSAVLVDKGELT
ncbi:hypothetical protein V8F20_002597 [Naviculisporaceae sp. PSN 640]